MIQTEFIRSMQCNYERILLEKQPEKNRYQYCILSRGGIKGLLPCSLRYLEGRAYLYYDITSKQSVIQLYGNRCITRTWVKDFVWSLRQVRRELGRFLLDDKNILWYPEQIFEELESHIFSFLYVPYYEGDNGFLKLLEYLVERIDYKDETLVECVYRMYEQYERNGEVYLQNQIFQDVGVLEKEKEEDLQKVLAEEVVTVNKEQSPEVEAAETPRKGIRYLFDGRKKKYAATKGEYQQKMQLAMEGYAVAEQSSYETGSSLEDDYGKTVYMEESDTLREIPRRLYTADGRILIQITEEKYMIGKRKEDVDLILDDFSVSRMHARISKESEDIYIEDLNSTNGTYKNGIRMQPYEKKKLEIGDEIKIGKIVLLYR